MNLDVAVTIIGYSFLFFVWSACAIVGVWIAGTIIRDYKENREDREEKPKKEKKGLRCLAGIHKWRYVRLYIRGYTYTPRKVFSISYYNKKRSFHVKFCFKCLKFKAERI